MHILSKRLKNGLRVFSYEFPRLETVGIALGVGFGSIDEPQRINGAAHFLEHMMFKGTRKRTWKDIADQLRGLGAYHNAFTDHETTVYFVKVYKGYFREALEILSDMIKNSTIPDGEFEKERGPIINENLIRHDNPKFMISDYMPRVLYRKHPARLSVGGDNEKSIRHIKRSELFGLYREYYTPKNCVLAVYGGVGVDEALRASEVYFGNFGGAYTSTKRKAAKEAQTRRSMTIARSGIMQTRIGIGFKCSPFSTSNMDEFLSFLVIEKYLASRLFEEVRQKHGLSYDPAAMYSPYSTFGFIAAVAGTEPEKLGEVRDIMLREFGRLEKGDIDVKEFERSRKALSIQYRIEREESSRMAIEIALSELMYSGPSLMERLPEKILEIRLETAKKYCRKYIDVGNYGMVVLKPKKIGRSGS